MLGSSCWAFFPTRRLTNCCWWQQSRFGGSLSFALGLSWALSSGAVQLEGGMLPSPCKGHGCPSAASLCRCTDESALAFLSQKKECPGKLGLPRASEGQVPGGAKFRFTLWRDACCPKVGRHQEDQRHKEDGGRHSPSQCLGEGCGLAALTLRPTAWIWVLGNTPAPRGQGQRGHRPTRCCPGRIRSWGGKGKGEGLEAPRSPGLRFPAEQRCHLVPRRLGPAPSPFFWKVFIPSRKNRLLENNQLSWNSEIIISFSGLVKLAH